MAAKKDRAAVDPAGVTPGIQAPPTPVKKTVALACRVPGCTGKTAIEVLPNDPQGGAPSQRVYQCTECQGTWGLPVGGFFPY
jgi:DNA-directed RNA polymerase subunit M/transcription elongation factor TFIIS